MGLFQCVLLEEILIYITAVSLQLNSLQDQHRKLEIQFTTLQARLTNLQVCDVCAIMHACRTYEICYRKICKGMFLNPVLWTAQSALHFSSPGRPVHSDTNSSSLGSILATQQLCTKTILSNFYHSIARYSFIQLSELGHHGENENALTLKRL